MLATLLLASTLFFHVAKPTWILTYHCDAPLDYCDGKWDGKRAFMSKQGAIDWAESNYQFRPVMLAHGQDRFECNVSYINIEDPDEFTRLRKEVSCDDKFDYE